MIIKLSLHSLASLNFNKLLSNLKKISSTVLLIQQRNISIIKEKKKENFSEKLLLALLKVVKLTCLLLNKN